MSNMAKEKGRQWDGKSRISNETYRQRWNEIFKKEKPQEEKQTEYKVSGRKLPLGID